MVDARRLTGFELACALTAERAVMNLVTVLRLRPGPAAEPVRRALAEVQLRHPLLRARIESRGRQRRFAPAAGEIPLRTVPAAGEASWREVAEEELATPFAESAAPLVRAALVGEGNAEAALLVTFHHAVTDGTGALSVLDGLLAAFAGSALAPAEPRTEALPLAATAHLPAPWRPESAVWRRTAALLPFVARQVGGELAYRVAARRRPRPAPPPARFRTLTLRLGPATASHLAAACRAARLTVHSALLAALLLAADRRLHGGRGGLLRAMVFPDLRSRLRPRTPPAAVVNHATIVALALRVQRSDALFDLARRVQGGLAAAFRRGDRYAAALLAPRLIAATLANPERRMADVALSYSGPIRLPRDPGVERFPELHAMVSNLAQGPPLTAQARWHRGALVLDFVLLAAEIDSARAAELVDEIRDLLTGAAGRREAVQPGRALRTAHGRRMA